jgi:hypothetical protein
VRHLDNFQLCLVDDSNGLVPLENVDGITEQIMAQGELIPENKGKPGMPGFLWQISSVVHSYIYLPAIAPQVSRE